MAKTAGESALFARAFPSDTQREIVRLDRAEGVECRDFAKAQTLYPRLTLSVAESVSAAWEKLEKF